MDINQKANEERITQHKKLDKFLRRIKWDILSPEDKIQRIKSMSFEEFISLMLRLNGIVIGTTLNNRKVEEDSIQCVSIRDTLPCIDHISPIEKVDLFQGLFQEIQTNLSLENLEKYAIKLRFGIDSLQLFEDGNGRTSIYVQDLLLSGEVGGEERYGKDFRNNRNKLGTKLRQKALNELIRSEIPEAYKYLLSPGTDGVLTFSGIVGHSYAIQMGYASALQATAFLKTIVEIEMPRKTIITALQDCGKTFNEISTGKETKEVYKKHYKDLQNKLFWKTQELLDQDLEEDGIVSKNRYIFGDKVRRTLP